MNNIKKRYLFLNCDTELVTSMAPVVYTDSFGRTITKPYDPKVYAINWRLIEENKDTGIIRFKDFKTPVIPPNIIRESELSLETLTTILTNLGVDYSIYTVDS